MLKTYEGGCHCGRVRFRAEVDSAFVSGCLMDPADPDRLDPRRIRDLVDAVRQGTG